MEPFERNWEWQISVQQYKAVGGCRVVEGRADKSNREELGMTYISRPLTVNIQKKKNASSTHAEHVNTKSHTAVSI